MATLVDKIPVRSRGIGEGSVMSSSASVKSHLDDAVELTCISALLSLSSPKCARSRDSSGFSQEVGRPNKIAKLNNSAPNTPRGVTQPSLDPGPSRSLAANVCTSLHVVREQDQKSG